MNPNYHRNWFWHFQIDNRTLQKSAKIKHINLPSSSPSPSPSCRWDREIHSQANSTFVCESWENVRLVWFVCGSHIKGFLLCDSHWSPPLHSPPVFHLSASTGSVSLTLRYSKALLFRVSSDLLFYVAFLFKLDLTKIGIAISNKSWPQLESCSPFLESLI